MKVKRSAWLHHPDLYILDEPIRCRRKLRPFSKPVIFRIRAPEAKRVWLVGNFTGNGFQNYEMKKLVDGYWECSVELRRGHYEYHFLVDGVPTADPHAHARVSNGSGGFNSIVEVG
jgi:1,4-alpha-glucan branching enzyme